MNPHLATALAGWEAPKTFKGKPVPDKSYWLGNHPDRIPTPEEEAQLVASGTAIPTWEWGAVCALAENIRQSNAERALSEEAEGQITRGIQFLDFSHDDFLHWPWEAMDAIMGGMAKGTLHFVVCPSKGGKTTLCRSATRLWIQQGKRIFYGGFELRAETLRTMYAADDCGIDPGDVLTGAWLHWTDRAEHRERMVEAYQSQLDPSSPYQRLRFSGFGRVNLEAVREMMKQAHDWGADAVIIDHVDHIGGAGNPWDVSMKVCHGLDEMAKQYGLVVIVTSQTNNDGKSRDLWRDHRPVRGETVKMGGHKLEVATTMMGFYRPVKLSLTKEERQMVESREKSVYEMLFPNANAFNVMAHRPYGSRIGQVGYVGWERGRIVDPTRSLTFAIEQHKHRIATSSK